MHGRGSGREEVAGVQQCRIDRAKSDVAASTRFNQPSQNRWFRQIRNAVLAGNSRCGGLDS
ncbi:hypothetical protein RBSH_04916 [Rhodopirellula baltica SH28]|uniref:Uncharacterized protein n=1 Tax=Rhodopirellula baltica SH28 TaxID=993517 RepID=K5D058_RHOBT|nr:hypothetical protein RBSH_04916 [Rhodopirellula baltica SH28]